MKKAISCILILAMVITMGSAGAFAESKTVTATQMKIAEVSGNVSVTNNKGKSIEAKKDSRVLSGYTIQTDNGAYCYLSLDDSKAVKLDQNTKVGIEKSGKKIELNVKSGQIYFDVSQKLNGDETMNIRTSNMTTGVRGTKGVVRVFNIDGKNETGQTVTAQQTEITLLEGRLFVNTIDRKFYLELGQRAEFNGLNSSSSIGQAVINEFILRAALEMETILKGKTASTAMSANIQQLYSEIQVAELPEVLSRDSAALAGMVAKYDDNIKAIGLLTEQNQQQHLAQVNQMKEKNDVKMKEALKAAETATDGAFEKIDQVFRDEFGGQGKALDATDAVFEDKGQSNATSGGGGGGGSSRPQNPLTAIKGKTVVFDDSEQYVLETVILPSAHYNYYYFENTSVGVSKYNAIWALITKYRGENKDGNEITYELNADYGAYQQPPKKKDAGTYTYYCVALDEMGTADQRGAATGRIEKYKVNVSWEDINGTTAKNNATYSTHGGTYDNQAPIIVRLSAGDNGAATFATMADAIANNGGAVFEITTTPDLASLTAGGVTAGVEQTVSARVAISSAYPNLAPNVTINQPSAYKFKYTPDVIYANVTYEVAGGNITATYTDAAGGNDTQNTFVYSVNAIVDDLAVASVTKGAINNVIIDGSGVVAATNIENLKLPDGKNVTLSGNFTASGGIFSNLSAPTQINLGSASSQLTLVFDGDMVIGANAKITAYGGTTIAVTGETTINSRFENNGDKLEVTDSIKVADSGSYVGTSPIFMKHSTSGTAIFTDSSGKAKVITGTGTLYKKWDTGIAAVPPALPSEDEAKAYYSSFCGYDKEHFDKASADWTTDVGGETYVMFKLIN